MRKLTATGSSRLATVLAGAALLALGVDAAAGQTGQTTVVRTYDVRLVGSVTTTAPDIVFTEKATYTFRRIRIQVARRSGHLFVSPVETRRGADGPNGVMNYAVVYEQTGATPCSFSRQFNFPARLEVQGSNLRSFDASGYKAGGKQGAVPPCRGFVDRRWQWSYQKGRAHALFMSSSASLTWVFPRLRDGRLLFPLNRISAHKSFTASASGTTNDGAVRTGSLRVIFTART